MMVCMVKAVHVVRCTVPLVMATTVIVVLVVKYR